MEENTLPNTLVGSDYPKKPIKKRRTALLSCIILVLAVLNIAVLVFHDTWSSQPNGLPQVYPCILSITQLGTPLEGAMVQLSPMDGKQSWSTAGITDENGNAKMRTYGKWNGAPLGKFKVTVIKYIAEGKENKEIFYSLVETQYTDPALSDLEIEIVKGENHKTFDVGNIVKEHIQE